MRDATRCCTSALIIATLSTTACASRVTDRLPPVQPLEAAAEVTVIRDTSPFGSALRVRVMLDGYEMAVMRTGQYVVFSVAEGVHSVGPVTGSISLPFSKGQRYYFLVTPISWSSGFEIERIDETEGRRRLASSKRLTPGR